MSFFRVLGAPTGTPSGSARAVRLASLSLALAGLPLASCTESAPLEPLIDDPVAPPNTTPPADAAPPYDVAACTTCLAKRCVVEHVRCYREPGCLTIANCANATNCNQECINKCVFKQVGFGRREYQALTTCDFEETCSTCRDVCDRSEICSLRSADPADAARPAVPVTCGDCSRLRCAEATKKCEPGTPCADYFACANPCLEPRQKCVDDCAARFAQGKADGDAVGECASTVCKAQCVY